MMESVVEEAKHTEKPIDREKTCPLLLRVFCSTGHHNSTEDYGMNSQVPGNELQIYTWMDATLSEISKLVREVNPDARRGGTVLDFSLVFPDGKRLYRFRPIGSTITSQKSPDDSKTLAMSRFNIGDYLDVAITPNSRVVSGRRGPRY